MGLIRGNLPVVVALVVGAVIVLAISLTTESTGAVIVTGLLIGILVGGVIAFNQRERR